MSLRKRIKQWVHKRIKPSYSFKPKAGTEKYRYRCPFCGRMTHAERFQTLELPNLDADIMLYGGYRGIRVLKTTMSSEMRVRVLEAMKEKLEWLYEKIGGDAEWLRSKSVLMRGAQNTSFLRMEEPSIPLRLNVLQRSGQRKSVKTSKILFEKHGKQSW